MNEMDELKNMGAKKVKIKKIFNENEMKHNKMKLIAVQDQ